MSRYDFTGIAPQSRVTIGWDRPLRTYFVQVMQTSPPFEADAGDADEQGDERTIVWIGTAPRELPYATDAIRIARAHAELPPDIGITLEMDRLRTIGESDGPAQRDARPFLSGDD